MIGSPPAPEEFDIGLDCQDIAELSAVLMGQRLGFVADHLENHGAYLGAWLRILRNDRRFLFKAGAAAQRAVDFLTAAAGQRAADLRPAA